MASNNDPPDWTPPPITEADAMKYVGKYILIGITKEDASGNVVDQYQIHGVIELVASNRISISLRGARQGESYVIPPALEYLDPAEPGEYRLRKTGEVVTDPDFTTSFTITAPQRQ
ncbi:MAG TPA: hypothetical protein VGQ35_04130 [Dongiaceae bacterium]|nr:hypothetical protein [Dongiaceae bacterium]